jgi:hypothetical protein
MSETRERNPEADRATVRRTAKALAAIHAHSGGRRGVTGCCPCPSCGTPLGYWVEGLNGHVRACCERPGCTYFVQ